MQDKGRKNILKYLMQASSAEDVINNHAYAEVARNYKPIPKRRPQSDSTADVTIAGYKDSMVGSISQYQNTAPIPKDQTKTPDDTKQDQDGIVGNRPRSGTDNVSSSDQASIERRHHFIEPPKRNFNGLD